MNVKRFQRAIRGSAAMLAAGLAVISIPGAVAQSSQRDYRSTYNRDSLPAGTVIPVRLDQALSSRDNSSGDKFSATVIRGSDDAGLPEGTRLEGLVRESTRSGEGQPGSLDVDFRRIIFPDGSAQNITASLYSLSGKAVKSGDGRLIATGDKSKDRLKFIGIGAGAGLLLGTVTKQNSLLSLLLGAGAGYLYNESGTKPKPGDVNLKQGQEFGVRLDRTLEFNSQTRRYYRRDNGSQVTDNRDNRYNQDNRYNGSSSEYADHVRVMLNDRPVRFNKNEQPYIRNGAVYLPLAAMGNAANFDYRYDSGSRMIYANRDDVQMGLGSRNATVRGQRRNLPTGAEQRNGVTFVPMQFVAWAANGTVGWDEASGTVNFNTNDR